jgi:hypothetical protein
MYGLMYVQPSEGDLPAVDREYYMMQSEFYHEPPEGLEDRRRSSVVEFSYPNALREEPSIVVFNGSESAMTRDRPLKANVGETIRVYLGTWDRTWRALSTLSVATLEMCTAMAMS